MNRYEIREQSPSDVALSYGLDDVLFVVWDTVADKRVPFGNHRSRERALRHIERLRAREVDTS